MLHALHDMNFDRTYWCDFGVLPQVGQPALRFSYDFRSSDPPGASVRTQSADGIDWFGEFQRGNAGTSMACRGPTPGHLTVITDGAAYVVRIDEPEHYLAVAIRPVLEVHRIPSRDILVFVGYSDITAYGSDGQLWFAEGLALDGIGIRSIDSESVIGDASGDDVSPARPFAIDVDTGRVTGGDARYLRSLGAGGLEPGDETRRGGSW